MALKFTNNANTTLATATLNPGDTALTVNTGGGALFPVLGVGDYFYFTISDGVGNIEICKCTARTGDSFGTIVRAQDNTSARTWTAGAVVSLRLVAAELNNIPKLDENNAFTGTNTATTASSGTNTTQIATTAFVNSEITYYRSRSISLTTDTALAVTDSYRDIYIDANADDYTVTLPDATTLTVGTRTFTFMSPGNFQIIINDNGGNLLAILPKSGITQVSPRIDLNLTANGTAAGTWTSSNKVGLKPYNDYAGVAISYASSPLGTFKQRICELTTTTYLYVYTDSSSALKARVLTRTNNTLSVGAENTVAAATAQLTGVDTLTSTTVLCTYRNGTNVISVVLSVSGTTVTAGTPVTITNSTNNSGTLSKVLTSTLGIVFYASTTQVLARTLSISGTTITQNTEAVIGSATGVNNAGIQVDFISSTKVVCAYFDSASTGSMVISTITGTTITPGSVAQPGLTAAAYLSCTVIDATNILVESSFSTFFNVTFSGTTITPVSVPVTTLLGSSKAQTVLPYSTNKGIVFTDNSNFSAIVTYTITTSSSGLSTSYGYVMDDTFYSQSTYKDTYFKGSTGYVIHVSVQSLLARVGRLPTHF